MTYTPQQQYAQPAGDVPLWAPLYGASAPDAVIRFFKKYATFSGRASRSEYWWWELVNTIVTILFYLVLGLTDANGTGEASAGPLILLGLWLMATIVPEMALTVRRLHDANLSGWIALLGLIPLVGGIIVLVFVLMGPKPEGQRFDQSASI
ncbi:DUF805 domain-containing protein [Arthrobacter globiformis]|jgi:uncharacterized membrane protein YhaH (DUF805 family)|uniref:DUF805 domain-containing protein n=1 Tax=Arthrobacter globiformis TaxID=1665 RepID=UPI00278F1CAF|nr:DUF805 domain-containing protein [Arthrobacter globiformis]MDQ0616768.1 uncharacterized membrane protein YhaH (DUF805 family) [Arthrobacter globiformis]